MQRSIELISGLFTLSSHPDLWAVLKSSPPASHRILVRAFVSRNSSDGSFAVKALLNPLNIFLRTRALLVVYFLL